MCIQLCCHGQNYVCSLDSKKALFIQTFSQITKKYIDWHENPALQRDLILLIISFDLNQYQACNSFKIHYLALKRTIPLHQDIVSPSPKQNFLFPLSVTLQVQLLYELLLSWSSTWARLQRHGVLRQNSSIPEPHAGAAPSSPVHSSAGTARPDTSTCSPSADFGSPTEVCFLTQLCISFRRFGVFVSDRINKGHKGAGLPSVCKTVKQLLDYCS